MYKRNGNLPVHSTAWFPRTAEVFREFQIWGWDFLNLKPKVKVLHEKFQLGTGVGGWLFSGPETQSQSFHKNLQFTDGGIFSTSNPKFSMKCSLSWGGVGFSDSNLNTRLHPTYLYSGVKYRLLPPANEVWGKVIFSQMSVCPGRVSVCCHFLAGCLVLCSFQGGLYPWSHVHSGGVLCPGGSV